MICLIANISCFYRLSLQHKSPVLCRRLLIKLSSCVSDDHLIQKPDPNIFLLSISFVRILHMIVWLWLFSPLLWLFSPAGELTLKVGCICPFMVIGPTYLGPTMNFVVPGLMLVRLQPIPNHSPTQNTCLFTNGNKASLSVCLHFRQICIQMVYQAFQKIKTFLP